MSGEFLATAQKYGDHKYDSIMWIFEYPSFEDDIRIHAFIKDDTGRRHVTVTVLSTEYLSSKNLLKIVDKIGEFLK